MTQPSKGQKLGTRGWDAAAYCPPGKLTALAFLLPDVRLEVDNYSNPRRLQKTDF